MMTEGQERALEQAREIEAASDGNFEIIEIHEAAFNPQWIEIIISLFCGSMPKAEGGLPLSQRERLIVHISSDFPFERPEVKTPHTRFAGFPHVQWGRHLCLYQSPATEWDPSDGFYGFIERLDLWLRQAALNQLDPIGAPIHPPVAYIPAGPVRTVIPRTNTPPVGNDNWYGTGHLKTISDSRVDICGWSPWLSKDTPSGVAAAILLSKPMPFEFPAKVSDLFSELASRGVPLGMILLTLKWAVLSNDESAPLYMIIGAPMRGIRNEGELKQHLTAWYIHPVLAQTLRIALETFNEDERFQEIGEKAERIFLDWAQTADIQWCIVREDRPEVVIRRDMGSPIKWFEGKCVAIWGCGALGSHVAEFLTRAGVARLLLYDKGIVGPGILARQLYDDADIGRPKAAALHDRLKRIRPELKIEPHTKNLIKGVLNQDDWTEGAEVIIDTTANETVLTKLESKWRQDKMRHIPVISMAIGHDAMRSLCVVAGANHTGGPLDIVRRVKVSVFNGSGLNAFADEFWPLRTSARRQVFQPEPGCSESTFTGSQADVAILSGIMINQVAKYLALEQVQTAFAHLFTPLHPNSIDRQQASFGFDSDIVSIDPHSGYEIRLAQSAMSEITAWMKKSRRERGPRVETGGLLFGERDDAAKVIWVSEVSGPPPDSEASEEGFVCGVEGTRELNEEKDQRTRGAVQYLGMWHSHPGSSPIFSSTDLQGMEKLVMSSGFSPAKSLLMIIGTPYGKSVLGTYVFSRRDFLDLAENGKFKRKIAIGRITFIAKPKKLGLALSGGGSRAIAFHLGCLRALHDRGLLDQVEVISAVSGGAVIAAMYVYSNDSFDQFDQRVVKLLSEGLQSRIARRALLSRRAIEAFVTNGTAGIASLGASLLRVGLLPFANAYRLREQVHAPFPRWVSASTAFEDVLSKLLFHDATLASPRRDNLNIVLSACELRTGAAFRFASSGSSCWRYGQLADNGIPVALAVAASAAYPAFLPAFDRRFTFKRNDGTEFSKRVILTDGGVYDNLGVTCLEPSRSSEYSSVLFCPERIVCCDAGQGLFNDHVHPYYWPSRMKRAFEAVYRKANDSIRKRLHDYTTSGHLKGFVLSYLGQQDRSLPIAPPDLIPRSSVIDYPTDFRAMSSEDIKLIAGRGEQLTRLLIARYVPEL